MALSVYGQRQRIELIQNLSPKRMHEHCLVCIVVPAATKLWQQLLGLLPMLDSSVDQLQVAVETVFLLQSQKSIHNYTFSSS